MKKRLLFVGILAAGIFLFTVLLDVGLGLLGYPSKLPSRSTYPPHFKQVRRSTTEFECLYEFNSRGIRYPEISFRKDGSQEVRFFMVGDSFTEGLGAEADETFGAVMERAFSQSGQDVRFINGGISGTGPLDYLHMLYSVGFDYDIDSVLICIYVNDMLGCPDLPEYTPPSEWPPSPDGMAAAIYAIYPRLYAMALNLRYYYSSDNLQHGDSRDIIAEISREARAQGFSEEAISEWRQKLPADLVAAANRFEFNGSVFSHGLLYPDRFFECLELTKPSSQLRFQNMKLILNQIVQECQNRSISVYTILIPAAFMCEPDSYHADRLRMKLGVKVSESWLTETTPLQSGLRTWAAEAEVPFFDLTDTFREAVKNSTSLIYYPLDTHWTPLGHQIAAEAIQRWLTGIEAIPPKASFGVDKTPD